MMYFLRWVGHDGWFLTVIYGDTDSIMIHSGLEDLVAAKTIAAKVIREVYNFIHFKGFLGEGIFENLDEAGLLV